MSLSRVPATPEPPLNFLTPTVQRVYQNCALEYNRRHIAYYGEHGDEFPYAKDDKYHVQQHVRFYFSQIVQRDFHSMADVVTCERPNGSTLTTKFLEFSIEVHYGKVRKITKSGFKPKFIYARQLPLFSPEPEPDNVSTDELLKAYPIFCGWHLADDLQIAQLYVIDQKTRQKPKPEFIIDISEFIPVVVVGTARKSKFPLKLVPSQKEEKADENG